MERKRYTEPRILFALQQSEAAPRHGTCNGGCPR